MEEIIYKIQTNKIKCKKCEDVIKSTYRHDFKMCSCEVVGVDGGHDYLRRIVKEEDYEELSFVRKLAKITTDGYKVIKSKIKQSEVLSQKDIKCPICSSDKITLMKMILVLFYLPIYLKNLLMTVIPIKIYFHK